MTRVLSVAPVATLLLLPSVALAQEGLRPIRGPIIPSFWEQNAIWLIPSIIAAAVLALLILIWVVKIIRRPKVISPLQRYQFEVRAMKSLLVEGNTEEIPARLSRVLRETIEGCTGMRSPERTTEEFLATASSASSGETQSIPPAAVDDLRTFLGLMDEAKYARRQLDSQEIETLLETADRIIEQVTSANAKPEEVR